MARTATETATARCHASHERQMSRTRDIRGASHGRGPVVRSGHMRPPEAEISPQGLRRRLDATPALEAVRDGAGELAAYLVGGAVRDLILGLDRIDLDVAIEASGEAVGALARRIDPDARVHDRFGAATVFATRAALDAAGTRAEADEAPGPLALVRPTRSGDDLGRGD